MARTTLRHDRLTNDPRGCWVEDVEVTCDACGASVVFTNCHYGDDAPDRWRTLGWQSGTVYKPGKTYRNSCGTFVLTCPEHTPADVVLAPRQDALF